MTRFKPVRALTGCLVAKADNITGGLAGAVTTLLEVVMALSSQKVRRRRFKLAVKGVHGKYIFLR